MRLVVRQRLTATISPWNIDATLYDIKRGLRRVGRLSYCPSLTDDIVMYSGQVGYRIEPNHQGHGYAAEAVRILYPIARSDGFDALWVTCNPDNLASIRTLEHLGADYVDTVDLPFGHYYYERGERQKRRYRLNVAG